MRTSCFHSRYCAALLVLSLSGCAGPEFVPPSLEHRAIEGINEEPIRAIAPVPSVANPALASRIGALIERAEAGNRDFGAALPNVRNAVSGAGGIESESWIRAQLMLSSLEEPRGRTTGALAELDAILAEQAIAGEPAETGRLIAARDRVAALADAQAQTHQALLAQLR